MIELGANPKTWPEPYKSRYAERLRLRSQKSTNPLTRALQTCIDSVALIPSEQSKLLAVLQQETNPVKQAYLEYQVELVDLQLSRACEQATKRLAYLRSVRDWETEKDKCKADIHHWFNQWAWTLDPRPDSPLSVVPFALFPFQEDVIDWLTSLVFVERSDGAVEKSRDQGWTWISTGWSTYQWTYRPYFQALFGSKNEDAVDSIEEPDTILEKVRFQLRLLPSQLLPKGFDLKKHMGYMKITNPENGSVIAGEAPIPNFGRSGRYTCLAGDTIVSTPEGSMSIEKAVRDRVTQLYDASGTPRNVQGYLVRRPEPLVTVTAKYGFRVEGSADHPLRVERDGTAQWLTLSKIVVGDKLILVNRGDFPDNDTAQVSDDMALILGYLVSEGCVNKKSHVEFAQKDALVMEDFQQAWEREFGARLPMREYYYHPTLTREVKWLAAGASRMGIRKQLAELGLDRVKAGGKSIPWAIQASSRSVVKLFLQSLFEGDGSVSYSKGNSAGLRVSYTSKSFRLLREIQELLLRFGILSAVRKDKRTDRDIGYVIIGGHGMALKFCRKIGFRSTRKQAVWQDVSEPLPTKNDELREGYWALPVQSVAESGADYTYDFQVEGHEFLANGFVSHNCIFFDEHAAWPHSGRPQWTAASASSKSKISASTPQGTLTRQAELVKSGKIPVKTLKWTLHPWKDQRWYDGQTLSMDAAEIAQEIDIDYEASQPGPVYAKLWEKEYHVIKWEDFARVFGVQAKPYHWLSRIYQDVGTSPDHPTATGFWTKPAMRDRIYKVKIEDVEYVYDLSECAFLYRTHTIFDEEIGNIWNKLADLMRPARERDHLQGYWLSHEAESERKTLRKNNVQPAPVAWKPGANRGIAEFKDALKLTNEDKPNPFKPWLYGFPKFMLIVANEQYDEPVDDFGGARFQAEIAAYHFPKQVLGEPVHAQKPYAFFNDHMDQSRMAAADYWPMALPLTQGERVIEALPAPLRPEAIREEPDVEKKGLLMVAQQMKTREIERSLNKPRTRNAITRLRQEVFRK